MVIERTRATIASSRKWAGAMKRSAMFSPKPLKRPRASCATLAADAVRLKALRAQCAADRQAVGEDACRAAAEAFRRRFFAGHTGPDEYNSLAELPPIPPSFDTPADELPEGAVPLTPPEDSP